MASSPQRWWVRKVTKPVELHAKPCRTTAGPVDDRYASRFASVGELSADLRDAFEERAAIAEVDGGLDRKEAERLAWAEVTGNPEGAGP
jgi:hypothetical protein